MKLTMNLTPKLQSTQTKASLTGTVLTLNGSDYDLSELPDGAVAQHPVLGKVTRNGDEYECTIRLGHPSLQWQPKEDEPMTMVRASEAMRFPEPVVMTSDGEIPLPQPEVWNMEEDLDPDKVQELAQ